jgi:hypothetical protein
MGLRVRIERAEHCARFMIVGRKTFSGSPMGGNPRVPVGGEEL